MKRVKIVLVVMVVVGSVLGVFSTENAYGKGGKAGNDAAKMPEPTLAGPVRGGEDDAENKARYEKSVQEQRKMLVGMVPMMAKRQLAGYEDMNNGFIERLKEVRQTAEVEGAVETVKLIDENIAQINAEYQERYDQVEAGLYKRFGKSDKGFEKAKRWHKNIQDDIEREQQQKAKEQGVKPSGQK